MKIALRYFLYSRAFFLIFAVLATFFIPLRTGYLGNEQSSNVPYLIWIWSNFDGQHFLDIATLGYRNFDFAFFPLYPLLIYMFKLILPLPALYIGILISSVSLFISSLVIYKIVKLDFNERMAQSSLLFLFFIPVGFFHHSVYADGLFLLTSTCSFYFARKKKWMLSGIFGFFTILTRLSGLALIPALLVEWYLSYKGKLFTNIPIGINSLFFIFLGLLTYMLYLSFISGDPLIFQKSMVAWSQSNFTFPLQVIYRYLNIFLQVDPKLLVYWIAVLEFFSLIAYFGLAIFVFIKIRASYGIFMIVLLTLVTFTGTFAGTPRYILHLFPAYIALAVIVSKIGDYYKKVILLVFLGLGFVLTALFTRGYFVS